MDKDIQRDLLDVLALFHCHQPTVHGKRLQTDQINLLHHVKWHHLVQLGQAFPTTKGPFNLVCQHGGGIHTHEARETIDQRAEECVSCCIWQMERTTGDKHLHPLGRRFDLLPQKNVHELEQARCAQRPELPSGLCRSEMHRGTRNELQRGPLHAQLAAFANLTQPERALDNPSLVQRLNPPVVLGQNLLDVRPSRMFQISKVVRKLRHGSYRIGKKLLRQRARPMRRGLRAKAILAQQGRDLPMDGPSCAPQSTSCTPRCKQ